MATLAQEGGNPTKFTINGKDWFLTRSTWQMQADWGEWLADRAQAVAMKVASDYRDQARPFWDELDGLRRLASTDEPSNPMPVQKKAEINARADVLIRKANTLEQAAKDAVERFQDRKTAGEFEFYSASVGQLAQMERAGQFYLIWLCLQPSHKDITLQQVICEHLPGNGPRNFIAEWRAALLESEGVVEKNVSPASSAPTTPQEATTEAMVTRP